MYNHFTELIKRVDELLENPRLKPPDARYFTTQLKIRILLEDLKHYVRQNPSEQSNNSDKPPSVTVTYVVQEDLAAVAHTKLTTAEVIYADSKTGELVSFTNPTQEQLDDFGKSTADELCSMGITEGDRRDSPVSDIAHSFYLSSGRVVHVNALHVSRTYANFLAGGRSVRANEKLILDAAIALEPLWDERPVHVISPPTGIIGRGRFGPEVALPPLRYHAWLTSDPLDSGRGGSELVLAWFGDECLDPFNYLAQVARGLMWEELARDWDY